MKKLFLLLPVVLIAGFLLTSCSDTSTNPVPTSNPLILVTSTPSGATVHIDNGSTSYLTPFTLDSLTPGDHIFKFISDGDTLQVFRYIIRGQKDTITCRNTSVTYSGVTIYETADTDTSHHSGLVLSTGKSISFKDANKAAMDLYYHSVDYDLYSTAIAADPLLLRKTYFIKGNGTDLNDGVNAPKYDAATWSNWMPDTSSSYYFVYDNDGHYSKLQITGRAGGTANVKASVTVKWLYKETGFTKGF